MNKLKKELTNQRIRWAELDTLIRAARKWEPEDREYASICRSISVLICSHFEGAIKGVSKAIVQDMADNLPFNKFPERLKAKYIRIAFLQYEAVKEKNNETIKQSRCIDADDVAVCHLADMVSRGEHQIDTDRLLTAFDHRSHIDMPGLSEYGKWFGVCNFAARLGRSDLEDAFADSGTAEEIRKAVEKRCMYGASYFPYRYKDISTFGLNDFAMDEKIAKGDTFFKSFLEEVLRRRHQIAHGNDLNCSRGASELIHDIIKMRILLSAYTLMIGNAIYDLGKE